MITDRQLMIVRGCIACGLSNKEILRYLGESGTTSATENADKKYDKVEWKKELASICSKMEKAASSQELENIYTRNTNRFAKSSVFVNCYNKCQQKFGDYIPY